MRPPVARTPGPPSPPSSPASRPAASLPPTPAQTRRRSPLTLWSHVMGELWRLILLTTCILVTVLSFAAAVRFLADGRLGPLETIRLMFLAMPPMLQYALPFAAGFGATLAYHRACTDNEMTAGHAAGISHRAMLAPAVVSGLVLAGFLLVLSNMFIPRFLRSMEELVTRDAARLIVNSIERKQAVQMENTLLYADLVRQHPASEGQNYEMLYLKGVFVIELDKEGFVQSQGSAREANVWLRRVERQLLAGEEAARAMGGGMGETVTHVTIQTKGMVGQQRTGSMTDKTNVVSRIIPNAFSDDPKFLAWDELIALRSKPEILNVVDSRRRLLAARLAERLTTAAIADSIRSSGKVRLLGDADSDVSVHAAGIHWDSVEQYWIFDPGVGADGKPAPFLVERTSATGRPVRQQAEAVKFRTRVDAEAAENQVTITLTMSGLTQIKEPAPPPSPSGKRDAQAPAAAEFKPQTLGELVVPGAEVAPLMRADASELLKAADERLKVDPKDEYVREASVSLDKKIADLMREITSKQHERFASAAACLVMVLTGAVMAVKLRSKLPLEVYLWAFFPALATVITISAGQQMIHSNGPVGIPIMWAGVVGLGVYTFLQYRQVARH